MTITDPRPFETVGPGDTLAAVGSRSETGYHSRERVAHLALAGILAVYLFLAFAYSVATPILEASDENWHEAVVASLTAGHGLPRLTTRDRGRLLVPAQEAGQPPLYYLLAAAMTGWVHVPPLATALPINPYADVGHPDRTGWNKNLFVHRATDGESFPWRGLALAVHVERVLSILFGAATVLVVFATVREVWPRARATALVAAALVAFNPMLLFISASVDNDALAFALTSVAMFLLVRLARCDARWPAALRVGIVIGLALLTKLSAGAVAAPAGAFFLWHAWRHRSLRRAAAEGAALVLPVLVIAGWWFLRNWRLYGDPLGLNAFLDIAGRRPASFDAAELLAELPGLWTAFWGVFGAYDVLMPRLFYRVYDILACLSVVGIVAAAVRHRAWRTVDPRILLLTGWLLLECGLLVHWTSLTLASSGRLLFPAIGSIALFQAYGLTALVGRLRVPLAGGVTLLLALLAAAALPLAILPAYAAPQWRAADRLRPAQPVHVHYGNLELVGVGLPSGPISPGGTARISLSLLVTGPISVNDVVSVQLHGPDGVLVGHVDALPGGGKLLTSTWPAGKGMTDVVPVRIAPSAPSPSRAELAVYVYPEGHPDQRVAQTNDAGQPITVVRIGRIAVRGTVAWVPARRAGIVASPRLPLRPNVTFANGVVLDAAAVPDHVVAGGLLDVTLRWIARRAPNADEIVTVRGAAPDGYSLFERGFPRWRVSTAFSMTTRPHGGNLPTQDWATGETIVDRIQLPIPPETPLGRYIIHVGLASAQTGRPVVAGATADVALGTTTVQPATASSQQLQASLRYRYDHLVLESVTYPAYPVAPGAIATVVLGWRVAGPITRPLIASVQLRGPDGVALTQVDTQPGGGIVPTTEWPVGSMLTDVIALHLPLDSPSPSLAHVSVTVYPEGAPGAPISPGGVAGSPTAHPVVGQLTVEGPTTAPPLPPLPLATHALFGGEFALIGAGVPAVATAGGNLRIVTRWRAERTSHHRYTLFVHAVAPDRRLLFQHDGQPHDGQLPTTDWMTGEIVDETVDLPIPLLTPAGLYAIHIGWYRSNGGTRLAVDGGGTTISLAHVEVRPAGGG